MAVEMRIIMLKDMENDYKVYKVRRDEHDEKQPSHMHPYYEIFYLLNGDCTFFLDHNIYKLSRGDLVIVPAGTIHKSTFPVKGYSDRFVICFKEKSLNWIKEVIGEAMVKDCLQVEIISIPEKRRDYVEAIINKMIFENEGQDILSPAFIRISLIELLLFIIRCQRFENNVVKEIDVDNRLIQEVATYIYDNYNKNKSEENNLINYTRYLDLYKEILLNDNPRETKKYSLNFMEQMIENYDKRHIDTHITQLEEFYKQGLLTLNTIIEWNDPSVIETFLTDLYKENIIQLNDVKKFVKNGNLPFEYIKQLVWEENINYEERLKLLEEGWIPEEEIFELYSKALIREDDLLKLSQKSIISKQKTLDIINNTQLQDLEKYSNIVLVIGDKLQKIKRDDSLDFNEEKNTSSKSSKPKLMIDPNERESLFSLLKAGKPNKVEISETSPFYNYEFYIIPDESGKVNLNSVIIAERIYEEKEEHIKNPNTTIKYATDNATYFFKYKDLMVLSNYLKKDDAIKETKNIIFKANHTLANDKRNGHWAASVIYGVAKTMLSSDLKEYSKDNQRKIIVEKLSKVYTYDELEKILDKGSSIDSGDSICEIIDYDDSDSR